MILLKNKWYLTHSVQSEKTLKDDKNAKIPKW